MLCGHDGGKDLIQYMFYGQIVVDDLSILTKKWSVCPFSPFLFGN